MMYSELGLFYLKIKELMIEIEEGKHKYER